MVKETFLRGVVQRIWMVVTLSALLLGASLASPTEVLADTTPVFQITVSPAPIVTLNFYTFHVQQTSGSTYNGPVYLVCYDPDRSVNIQTQNFTVTNGTGSVLEFANTDLSYQAGAFTIDCNLYYSVAGVMTGYPGGFYFTIRQLEIGDSFYKGGQNGPHQTNCPTATVPYGAPCPTQLPPSHYTLELPGVYLPSSGAFFLRNTNDGGLANNSFSYGPANLIPLAGDWTGLGYDAPGVYDPPTGTFYLRNTMSPGAADITFQYGPPNAIPLVGDWTGSGKDTIGVYVSATGTFYLKNSNSGGLADITVQYGPPNSTPIVGDWSGTGATTLGIYLPSTGTFYLKNSNTGGIADTTFQYGPTNSQWTPLAGQWAYAGMGDVPNYTNVSGQDGVGLYDPSTGTFYQKNTASGGLADEMFRYGPAGAKPVIGDWQ